MPGGWENVDKPAANTTDATTFVGLYEDVTGTTGPKTNTGLTYNATTGALGTELVTLTPKTVAQLASVTATDGSIVYVSDETGGGVVAFYDGTNWRRVTDRVVVS